MKRIFKIILILVPIGLVVLLYLYFKTNYLKFIFNQKPAEKNQTLTQGYNGEEEPENDLNARYNLVYAEVAEGKLRLDLYFPKTTNKEPQALVLYVHGGGWSTGDKRSTESVGWVENVVANGFAVASVNYRLAPTNTYPAQLEDLKSALEYLANHADEYNLDMQKVGLMGSSAGGHLASLLALTYSKDADLKNLVKVKAMINLWGPTDLTAPDFSDETKTYINQFLGDAAKAQEASPINFVSSDAPPFLLVHGTRDKVVPYNQSEKMLAKLKENKVKSALVTVINGVHYFIASDAQIRPTKSQLQRRMIQFFNKYIKGQV